MYILYYYDRFVAKVFNRNLRKINPTEILPSLIAKGLLTDDQRDVLSHQNQTNSAKKEYLLCNVLLKFTKESVNKFLDCLRETSHYEPHNELLKIICGKYIVHMYGACKYVYTYVHG